MSVSLLGAMRKRVRRTESACQRTAWTTGSYCRCGAFSPRPDVRFLVVGRHIAQWGSRPTCAVRSGPDDLWLGSMPLLRLARRPPVCTFCSLVKRSHYRVARASSGWASDRPHRLRLMLEDDAGQGCSINREFHSFRLTTWGQKTDPRCRWLGSFRPGLMVSTASALHSTGMVCPC